MPWEPQWLTVLRADCLAGFLSKVLRRPRFLILASSHFCLDLTGLLGTTM